MQRLMIVLVIGVAALTGCERPPQRYPVSGTVTWEGKPLADGMVCFYPTDGSPPGSGELTNGRFRFELLPGPHRVEVYGLRAIVPPPPDPYAKKENYLPARYNTASTLIVEVRSDLANEVNLDLTDDDKRGTKPD